MGRRHSRNVRDWQSFWWLSGGALLFAMPLFFSGALPMLAGQEHYDGLTMFQACFFFGVTAVFVTWIPHVFAIADGYLPAFAHERNTPALFWHLVAMTTVCALLFGVAPFLPLADGYDFSAVVLNGKHGSPIPLWVVAPIQWAASALLLYRTARGLWRRLSPRARKR